MNRLIDFSINRSRAVLLILLLILMFGGVTYTSIPREMSPEVTIPLIYVSMTHEGISPQDGERLLLRPMETELRSIEGIKEMTSQAVEGNASVTLEFDAGFDSEMALQDVREKVDLARSELPEETDEPKITEVNFSLFPVVNVILTGNISQRALIRTARSLKDKIEEIPNVLSVNIAGDREETVEIIVDPRILGSYEISLRSVFEKVVNNNLLVAAGAMDTGSGNFSIKLPGLLEDIYDILTLPVKVDGDIVVTVADIATLRKTYKDPTGYARANGHSAVVLEVSKRTGKNIIKTIEQVKAVVEEEKKHWPNVVNVLYAQDISKRIIERVSDLENNVILALLLVVVVILAVIGIRSALLIGLAIPGAFLFGVLFLDFVGATLNIVVLFSLILSIGMLVDAAIVVCEYADRKMLGGMPHKLAYSTAAKTVKWPVIASTITTLLVFFPLLFWPGIMGQFMKYMPLTLIATLTGSVLMALIFLPTLGAWLGRARPANKKDIQGIYAVEQGQIEYLSGITKRYALLLDKVLDKAGIFSASIAAILISVYILYGYLGNGVEFFPDIEPDNAQVQIRARGNLSIDEKDRLVKEVEERIYDMQGEIRVIYARSGGTKGRDLPEDLIGMIQIEFSDWDKRRKADVILADIRERTKNMGGIIVETRKEESGPPAGRPIEIQVVSRFPELLEPATEKIVNMMQNMGGFLDMQDDRPVPSIEWEAEVNREKAAKYQADIRLIGDAVKMVTNGLIATSYRPDETDDEVDIVLRFPDNKRNMSELNNLRVTTEDGVIPIGNFITRTAKRKVDTLYRAEGARVINIKSDLEPGVLVRDKVDAIQAWFDASDIDSRVNIKFKGEDESQKETQQFLVAAFVLALAGMILIFLFQFNSIYKMLIIMSAVFLSTVGVLLGLLATGQPFGIVMCGVGIISLSGIVVNNNIIFIDTYIGIRKAGVSVKEAIMRTGIQRVRAILLTAGTTILGLLPMVMGMNLDFITREVTFGAPSSQWWRQLSTSIAGGLLFATVLTLFFTPSLLMLEEKLLSGRIGNILSRLPIKRFRMKNDTI